MFNAKSIIKTGANRKELPSMPFSDLISELSKTGFVFDAVTTTHSNNLNQDRLVLGVVGADGFIDYKQQYVSIRLSPKVQWKSHTDSDMFNEAYQNYPVFFGESKIMATEEELKDGADEFRLVSWITIAPAGEYVAKKASAINVAALLGNNVAGMPAK